MIITLELEPGEVLPSDFAKFILRSGPYYQKRYLEPVPPITVRLIRDGTTYVIDGGFWKAAP